MCEKVKDDDFSGSNVGESASIHFHKSSGKKSSQSHLSDIRFKARFSLKIFHKLVSLNLYKSRNGIKEEKSG